MPNELKLEGYWTNEQKAYLWTFARASIPWIIVYLLSKLNHYDFIEATLN